MKVALGQLAPVLLNRAQTLTKVLDALREAADHGAELAVFGETLVPGYPAWVERTDGARFESDRQKDIFARYVREAVDVDAGDLSEVARAARELAMHAVLGVAERDRQRGRSLFASAVVIDPTGEVRSTHRKLVPTYEERLVWSPGDAHGLRVHPAGPFQLGVLNCWENWMPLPRAALHAQGETLHIALWPGSVRNTEPLTRFLAREGRSYVVSVSSVLRGSDVPSDFPHRATFVESLETVYCDGGSCVAGPDGEWVLPPVGGAQEGLLYAELDPLAIDRERQSFDPAGHYARPELLELHVKTGRPSGRIDQL